MLNPNPEKRAGLDDIFQHAWFLKVGSPCCLHHAWPCSSAHCTDKGRVVPPWLALQGSDPSTTCILPRPPCPAQGAHPLALLPPALAGPRQDLPPGALGMNDWYMDNADSLQDRLELVQTIVVRRGRLFFFPGGGGAPCAPLACASSGAAPPP